MSWRGEMSDARDMSVSNLLKSVMDRIDKQKTAMESVTSMLSKMQRVFLITSDRSLIMNTISQIMDESSVLESIIVTAGDKNAMMYLIHRENILTNQLIRPRPRVRRTMQLFNKFRQAWRYAIGLHMAGWEEVIQANTISIIKDVPIVKPSSANAKQSFITRIKDMMVTNTDIDTEDE